MSHPPPTLTSTSTSTSPLTTLTTLPSTTTTTTTTTPDLFGNAPYYPANLDVTVLLTASSPTSTSTSATTTNGTTLPFALPTTPLQWFEQTWIPLVVWLLFAYSLASAVVLIWMWCVESWTLSTGTDALYEYRIQQSVVDAWTVDEMVEDERFRRLSMSAEEQHEEEVRRGRDRRHYVEMSDAAARMGTF